MSAEALGDPEGRLPLEARAHREGVHPRCARRTARAAWAGCCPPIARWSACWRRSRATCACSRAAAARSCCKLFPAQQRSKAALAALDVVNGDGYAHKGIWVEFEDGEIRRARTWFWAGRHSSKILAWRTDKTEHTELMRLSFGDLVERYGIPRAVLIDNTRAAANKTMSGGVRAPLPLQGEGRGARRRLQAARHRARASGRRRPRPGEADRARVRHRRHARIRRQGARIRRRLRRLREDYNGKTRPVPIKLLEGDRARGRRDERARGRRGAIHQGRSWDAVFAESYARITDPPRDRRAAPPVAPLHRADQGAPRRHDHARRRPHGRRAPREPLLEPRAAGPRRQARRRALRSGAPARGRARLHRRRPLHRLRRVPGARRLQRPGRRPRADARPRSLRQGATPRSSWSGAECAQAGATPARRAGGSAGAADSTIPAPKVIEAIFTDPLERPRFVPPSAPRPSAPSSRSSRPTCSRRAGERARAALRRRQARALESARRAPRRGRALAEPTKSSGSTGRRRTTTARVIEAEAEFQQGIEARRSA
jgi:hypothetical protein